MIIFTPNTVIQSTQVNSNFNELLTSKTVDANGWTVYDLKASGKIYRKRVTFSQTIATATGVTISSTNLPVGISNFSSVFFNYSYHCSGNAFGLSMVSEVTTSSSALNFSARSNDGASRTYTGFIDLIISTT